jgi:GNAT superfamily N-acetyltransferase
MVYEKNKADSLVADGQDGASNETIRLTAWTGFSFDVRPADEADEIALAEFFAEVTKEDLRFRFLSAVQKVGDAQLTLLTHSDHRHTENFLALDAGVGCVLASAMLAADDDFNKAEVAIVIRKDFKNRGIGWRLLNHVSQRAAALGVKTLQAIESQDNHAAIEVERDQGFKAREYPGDPTLLILEKDLTVDHAMASATVAA